MVTVSGTNGSLRNAAIPVMRSLLPSADRILPYLRRLDETRVYSNHGPLSLELERRLACVLGLPAGGLICASSGTAALVGAILATAGHATADRPLAILPALTFVATAAAAEQCGYEPYLADIDPASWMLDPSGLIGHPERKRIGVVIPVAPFGRPIPQEPWLRFQESTGIPVVIDGAASFAALADRPAEFLGRLPVAISFHATKPFATGEGGAVATADVVLAERSAQALNFGMSGARDCRMPSTNGKMSEYHAAVGLAELDGWPEKLAAFLAVAGVYRTQMLEAKLADRYHGAPDIAPSYALFECHSVAEADQVRRSLRRNAIDFRLWYGRGMHEQTNYTGAARDGLAVTRDLAPRLFGIPMAADLSRRDVQAVVSALVGRPSPQPDRTTNGAFGRTE